MRDFVRLISSSFSGSPLWWFLLLLGSLVVGILLASAGEVEVGMFIAPGLVIFLLGGVLVFAYPVLLVYFVALVSASVSAFREITIPLGTTEMTLSGLLWLGMAAFALTYILANARRIQLPRYLWPFVAFSAWAVVRWLLTPTGFVGLKDVLWYSMPVIFGLFTPLALGQGDTRRIFANIRRVEKAFLYSALIPPALFAVALGTGLAEMTWHGPRGDLVGSARGTPLYLLVVLAIALSGWRYGPGKRRGSIFALISLGTIYFTLARMASFLGTILFFLSRTNPRRKWQILGGAFIAAIVFFYAATNIPVFEQRFFFRDDWSPSMGLRGVNTAGRNIIWPVIFSSAMQEPWIGHGLGVARLITAKLFAGKFDVTEYHPHNEYLQVFHDMGVIGVLIISVAWFGTFFRLWYLWEHGTQWIIRKWAMVGMLITVVVIISSVTDNTLHYPIVIVPASVALSIAHVLSKLGRGARNEKGTT